MTTKYVEAGDVLDYTNSSGSTIAADTLLAAGQILGVAASAIANGSTGSVLIKGVFTLAKVSGAVIAQGESLTFIASSKSFDDNLATPGAGDITGACAVAFEAAGNGVTSLKVLLTGVPGTVH